MEKNKVYVVVLGISGSGYESDDPMICGIFNNLEKAQKCMKKTYKEYVMPGEKETTKEDMTIEETNFDADYHFIIRIYIEEIK